MASIYPQMMATKTLKFGISPCPNDTFIFENMILDRISIPNTNFEWEYHDIQVLNDLASDEYFDVVKISFAHLNNVSNKYQLLNCGGAMGYGVGPILVKRKGHVFNPKMDSCAIPGLNTTAHLLLSHFFPSLHDKEVVLFSDIEESVLNGKHDVGLLIHEGRFTYQSRGLELIADLGDLWHKHENLPIPLGCIVAKQTLPNEFIKELESAIHQSISNYHQDGSPIISDFIRQHADEMDDQVIRQHIDLYVNEFSKNIGTKGTEAIARLHTIRLN
jgi:1,4-dihydroxy-6-naphthoate synthase